MEVSEFVEKPLLEQIQDLLERNPATYDVAFCVGKEKKIVRALKVILKASSPFLEKEFEEKWEVAVVKEGDGFPLPDFNPIAFELFVKLTSLDTWSLESLKALNLTPNQILNLISICRRFEIKKAEKNLKILDTISSQSFGEYKDTEDFLQLSQRNLKFVLGSDDIEIKELDVFYAAVRWADFQCRQMQVLPTEEQLREVLGDCLFEIRFPLMTCTEFTEARDLKDILTAEETIGIYGFVGSTGNKKKTLKFDSKKLPFKTTPRKKVQTLESKLNSVTNNSESLIPRGVLRLGSTQALECAKNNNDAVHAFNVFTENGEISVVTLIDEAQLRPQSLESASSLPLSAKASLSKTICWGKKINVFPPRSEHAAVAIDSAIYCFGGEGYFGDPSCSRDVLDVFVLNVDEPKQRWKELPIKNSEVTPNQRYGHSAVAHKEFVLIFGGLDRKKRKCSNSTYRLNTKTLKWEKPKVTGNVAAPRWDHSAVVIRNEMLVYGGVENNEVKNDFHSLDLESFRWSTIETNGIPPPIRSGHSATVHDDRFILIFGGYCSKKRKGLDTIACFDLDNKTWTAVETRGTPPSSRKNHCAFVHNGRMYIFGGSYEDTKTKYFNDVFSYDPENFEWKEVTPNGKESPRSGAECVALSDQVFIFGGYNSDEQYVRDTCVLQM